MHAYAIKLTSLKPLIILFHFTEQYVYITLICISERVYQTHHVVAFTFWHGDAANPFLCHFHCTKQVFLCSFVLHWYLSFEYNYTVLYISICTPCRWAKVRGRDNNWFKEGISLVSYVAVFTWAQWLLSLLWQKYVA